MNNDYLWDRTGSDADIERLESLLGGMKFQPDGPPAREIVIEPARDIAATDDQYRVHAFRLSLPGPSSSAFPP